VCYKVRFLMKTVEKYAPVLSELLLSTYSKQVRMKVGESQRCHTTWSMKYSFWVLVVGRINDAIMIWLALVYLCNWGYKS